jgi:hypothetical protein
VILRAAGVKAYKCVQDDFVAFYGGSLAAIILQERFPPSSFSTDDYAS